MIRKQLKKLLRYDIDTGIFYNYGTDNIANKMGDDGHIYLWIDGNKYRADKIALFYVTGTMPKNEVSHLNGNRQDLWITNLQIAPNNKNRKDNKSGVPGVSWEERSKKWRSSITVEGRQKNLGVYKDKDRAILARLDAEKEHGLDYDSPAQQYINKMFL